MKVIVTQPTEGAMAYAKALERRGFEIVIPKDKYHYLIQTDEPIVMTRPVVPYVTGSIPQMYDVEGLGIENLGLLAAGDRDITPPAIGVAVEWWLGSPSKEPVDVIGHGLGTAIALWLCRQGWNVCHWHYYDFKGTPRRPIINASRKSISRWFSAPEDGRLLDLPSNPPEFSRRLIDIVVERAEALCGL